MEALVRSLPASADQIRRRFWCDPEFRSVCEDYRDAVEMVAKLKGQQPPDSVRAAEYDQLAGELLAEAKAMLQGAPRRP
jgi:hypothetical protein